MQRCSARLALVERANGCVSVQLLTPFIVQLATTTVLFDLSVSDALRLQLQSTLFFLSLRRVTTCALCQLAAAQRRIVAGARVDIGSDGRVGVYAVGAWCAC